MMMMIPQPCNGNVAVNERMVKISCIDVDSVMGY